MPIRDRHVDRVLAVGAANAQATKLSVDAYGGPEFRLAEQNFTSSRKL